MDLLWKIVAILIILWLIGGPLLHLAGSIIHILLVVAIIVVLVRIIEGRKPF